MHTFYKYLAILCLLALPLAVGGCNTCTEADEARLEQIEDRIDQILDRLNEIEDSLDQLEEQMDSIVEQMFEYEALCPLPMDDACRAGYEALQSEWAALASLYGALLLERAELLEEAEELGEEHRELMAKCPDWIPGGDAPQSDGGEAAMGDDGVTPIMDGDKAVGAGGEGGTVTLR